MRRSWKKNAVLALMLVLVGTAVFLNWKYTDGASGAAEAGKLLGEATLVSGSETDAVTGAAASAGAADEAEVYNDGSYFATARLTRQQARDSAIELLEKAAAEEGAAQSAGADASEGIQVLAAYTMKEAQIENLVTAKGYRDCVAFMGDESISVVVSTDSGELTEEDVAKIKDITVTESGYPASAVKIMTAE